MARSPITETEAPAAPCPICGKAEVEVYAPFCSQRCADVDLGRWLGERYAIPGPDTDGDKERDEDVSH